MEFLPNFGGKMPKLEFCPILVAKYQNWSLAQFWWQNARLPRTCLSFESQQKILSLFWNLFLDKCRNRSFVGIYIWCFSSPGGWSLICPFSIVGNADGAGKRKKTSNPSKLDQCVSFFWQLSNEPGLKKCFFQKQRFTTKNLHLFILNHFHSLIFLQFATLRKLALKKQ